MTLTAPPQALAPTRTTGTVSRWQRIRRGLQGTPGRLRLVSAGLIVVGLVVGLGAGQSFRVADGALTRATENAAQLVRLQEIQTSLVRADADVTNAFLVGGLEPAEQRLDYDEAVGRASELVAYAARAQPADGEALAALNVAIQEYTATVQQARANNRQGLPLGAQYLRNASAGLRGDALPLLESLTTANEERATTEFSSARLAWLTGVGAGLVGVVLIAASLVWLARRTHRYVNVPVAAAGAVVLGVLVVTATTLGGVAGTVGDVEDGPYASARALSDARIAAFDAKSNESLTLISRGSGAAFEEAWATSSATVEARVADAVAVGGAPDDLPDSWAAYTTLHQEIRALDDGGSWELAVAAATSTEPGSANAAFTAFDETSAALLTESSDSMSSTLADASSGLMRAGLLGLLAGVVAAALAWWGLSLRIEEYR